VPVLVLRNVTERGEGVAAGTLRLVGTDPERITETALNLLNDPGEYQQIAQATNPYGDGQASRYIIETLGDFLFEGKDRPALLSAAPKSETVEAKL
jgi:UDP-N-acetylglucosamine 2-epimerase (non-hydrolysing)